MSVRQSRGYKIFLVLLSLVCLAGAGYLGYITFFAAGGSGKSLAAAEDSYGKGEAALEGNPAEAFKKFDEAIVYAERGLNAFADETAKKTLDDAQKKVEGKLNWVYARALRDRAYAAAKQDGKPLSEPTDTTSGKTYRAVLSMPDADEPQKVAKRRAVDGLMRASELLADDPQVVLEATRVALVGQPLNWAVVERLMRDTLKFSPNDSRANYFLARYEFDQPQTENGVWVPRPAEKKDKERVKDALKFLDKAVENKVPYWRAVHLKGEILAFEVEAAAKAKNDGTAKAKGQELDALLFDKGGVLEKAARGEEMAALSSYDGNGVLFLHLIALERATQGTPDPAKVKRVAENAVAAGKQLAESKTGGPFIAGAGEVMLDSLLAARRVLRPMDPVWWKEVTGQAEEFLNKYPVVNTRVGVVGKRTQLAPDPDSAEKMLVAGLEAARKQKVPPSEMSDLLAELANLKLLTNDPAAEVEPIIRELRQLDVKQVKARVDYLEGVLAERQGRLAQARKLYQTVLDDKDAKGTTLAFLASMRLGPVCLATGDPASAARHFGIVADRVAGVGGLTAEERAWAEQATAGRDEVIALQAVATVRAKVEQIQSEARRNPNKPVPVELKQQTERAFEQITKDLRPPSKADRTARLALAEFELAAGDKVATDKLLASLATDYPDDLNVLRATVTRIVTPGEGKKTPDQAAIEQADKRIDQFVRANPQSKAGKLFKAEWLLRSRRPGDAVEYLKTSFTDPDDVVKRLLAGALLQTGQREEAQKVLAQLPPDLGVDLAIIQAAGSKEEAEKGLKSAIDRYENNGLLKLYDGMQKLNAKKYEEAAREFAAAGEFTAVSTAANSLLQQTLIAYAAADRKKAAPFIHTVIAEHPTQIGLYQAAALVAKYTDDIGTPADQWGPKKTMYAAVNQWANLSTSVGVPPETVGMMRVAYHDMAGAPLAARQEAIKALANKPAYVPALLYVAQSYMFGPSPDLTEAKKYIDRANAVPESTNPAPVLLEGAWLERSGKTDDAAKLYERMMTQYPTVPAPYARRVELAAAANKPGEAVSWARKWVEKMPNDASAITELVRRLAEAGEDDTAAKTGDDWIKQRIDTVTADLNKRTPPPPADKKEKELAAVRAAVNLAVAVGFSRAKKYPEAKKRVEAVLKDDPDSGTALIIAGDVAMAAKNWDEAEQVYRRRLGKAPEDFVAANNLAWVLAEYKNNPAEALKLLDAARLSGNDTAVAAERLPADFLDTYGRVCLKAGQKLIDDKQPEKAKEQFVAMRQMFEGAIKRYIDDPRLYRLLGEAYLAVGDNTRALATLNAAIKLADDPTVKTVPDDQKAEAKKAAEAARSKMAGK